MKHIVSKLLLATALILCANSGAFADPNNAPIPAINEPTYQCDITSNNCLDANGNPMTAYEALTVTGAGACTTDCAPGYQGARSDPGPAVPTIDAWNACYYVDNCSSNGTTGCGNMSEAGTSIFVPFKSSTEWHDFISAHPSFTNLVGCARPMSPPTVATPGEPAPIVPDANCGTPGTVSSPPTLLPYTRNGQTQQSTASFNCTDTACASSNWNETATATYLGLDSNTQNPDWQLQGIAYSSPPTCVAGQCGAANGVGDDVPPASNLCAANNTASAVSGNPGAWNWTCTGANGGSTATCGAPLDGVCGTANNAGDANAPWNDGSNLCAAGTADTFGSNGSWTWVCEGTPGGAPASCAAPMENSCGSTPFTCNVGSPNSEVTSTTDHMYYWSCTVVGLGGYQQCSLPMATCPAGTYSQNFDGFVLSDSLPNGNLNDVTNFPVVNCGGSPMDTVIECAPGAGFCSSEGGSGPFGWQWQCTSSGWQIYSSWITRTAAYCLSTGLSTDLNP